MTEHGYQLRGGRQPDVAALAHLLAHHDIAHPDGGELSEPLLFLASGGIGAGYRLWDMTRDGGKPLRLGFRFRHEESRRWLKSTVDRLGLRAELHTGTARGAAKRLSALLAEGEPALVLPDRARIGYWHLPDESAGGEHFVVAYAQEDGRVHLDDRNLTPLTVERDTLTAAGRAAAERNLLATIRPEPLTAGRLAAAVRAGLAEGARQLSTVLPVWTRWATLMTDERAVTGWPTVFADRRGLVGALLAIWTAIDPDGIGGGHLRDLFADGLAEAATLLEMSELDSQADGWWKVAAAWQDLADTALDPRVPEFRWMRELVRTVRKGVTAGDEGRQDAAEAGAELARLRRHYDEHSPFTADQAAALLRDLGRGLREVHAAEHAAVTELTFAIER
ncbi:BtrH N-terminal domain-containing protein [Amycolatopsis aidingensis]|uniref:BtrH N-terminal domain-containing protein n=1 Tax=Amycolatopsis aidingensis TaxID=2842453 RepID=UPI001E5D8F8A|nr:BtrH N-terminal domain-containing protein [Amycolatopsis aidingensis]